MGAAAIIELILQYGPVAAKLVGDGIAAAPAVKKFLTDAAAAFETKGFDPTAAVAKAFSMHITPPSQWTQEEYQVFWDKASGTV